MTSSVYLVASDVPHYACYRQAQFLRVYCIGHRSFNLLTLQCVPEGNPKSIETATYSATVNSSVTVTVSLYHPTTGRRPLCVTSKSFDPLPMWSLVLSISSRHLLRGLPRRLLVVPGHHKVTILANSSLGIR